MKKLKAKTGIIWAILGLPLIIILSPGMNSFSESAAKLPFVKINPNYTGGEVARQIISPNCTIDIRKPVFNGLTGERKNGFVQVDWRGKIPEEIIDTIDFNLDNLPDFRVHILTKQERTEINAFNSQSQKLIISTPTSYGWAIRVKVTR
ncbi:MAG: hypothetical protein IPN67_07385 [Bacteroidales bacterium]|nr:hypothetical protein [Bacteroidales bacterium]